MSRWANCSLYSRRFVFLFISQWYYGIFLYVPMYTPNDQPHCLQQWFGEPGAACRVYGDLPWGLLCGSWHLASTLYSLSDPGRVLKGWRCGLHVPPPSVDTLSRHLLVARLQQRSCGSQRVRLGVYSRWDLWKKSRVKQVSAS